MKTVEQFLKAFQATAQVMQKTSVQVQVDGTDIFEKLKDMTSVGTQRKLKIFRALFCEGLMLYAITSKSKTSLASIRAQQALIAGEQIESGDVQPALLQKCAELTEA